MEHHPPSFIAISTASQDPPHSIAKLVIIQVSTLTSYSSVCIFTSACKNIWMNERPQQFSVQLSFHVTFCVVVVGLLQTSCQSTLLLVFVCFVMLHITCKSLWWCMVNCHQSLSCILFPCWLNMTVIIVTRRVIANLSRLLAFQLKIYLIGCNK